MFASIDKLIDSPWKIRVMYYSLLVGSVLCGVLPARWGFLHAINWATAGYVVNSLVSFERYMRRERVRLYLPLRGLLMRIRWILLVTQNLPAYLRLQCVDQDLRRIAGGVHSPEFMVIETQIRIR